MMGNREFSSYLPIARLNYTCPPNCLYFHLPLTLTARQAKTDEALERFLNGLSKGRNGNSSD